MNDQKYRLATAINNMVNGVSDRIAGDHFFPHGTVIAVSEPKDYKALAFNVASSMKLVEAEVEGSPENYILLVEMNKGVPVIIEPGKFEQTVRISAAHPQFKYLTPSESAIYETLFAQALQTRGLKINGKSDVVI